MNLLILLLPILPIIIQASTDDWVSTCRSVHGYDPDTLSCSTCKVLEEHLQSSTSNVDNLFQVQYCWDCCNTISDNVTRVIRPYKAAVLVDYDGSDTGTAGQQQTEIQQFVNENMDELIVKKGGEKKLKRLQPSSSTSSRMLMYGGFHRQVSKLYFFNDDIASSGIDLSTAIESVRLDGMKKDDIRDMVDTMLPNS